RQNLTSSENPSPRPPLRFGEGEKKQTPVFLPLSASGRGSGEGVVYFRSAGTAGTLSPAAPLPAAPLAPTPAGGRGAAARPEMQPGGAAGRARPAACRPASRPSSHRNRSVSTSRTTLPKRRTPGEANRCVPLR